MALRFGVVKFILLIALLIAIVQLLTVYHFTLKYTSQIEEKSRRTVSEIDDYIKFSKFQSVYKQSDDDDPGGTFKTNEQLFKRSDVSETTLPNITMVQCAIQHKDALSALKRAKSDVCKKFIYRTSCLNEAGTLYWKNITRLCPLDRSKGRPSHAVEPKAPYGPHIRILYAMVVHGRAFRQVKRLFKALFHANHYFYFHVDSRSNHLHRQIVDMVSEFKNVAVAPWRMATIWGGASLLKMLLRMMKDALSFQNWKWDFFINLSASCYPVQTDEKLSTFLRSHRDENFLKPHGGSVERFVKKQGISKSFLECDEHMWRLGDRKLPDTIDFDGGSDWICLNKKFVDYVVNSQDTLVLGLKQLYSYTLLPAESYFHSVLRNSPYCETYAKGNLRLTNWKRKLGCRCQYKHIVDWCGCSPNNFKPEDFARLKSQTLNHFARKFEPIVNQGIINLLDEWLYGKLPSALPGLNSYWESAYHHLDDDDNKFDVYMTFYQSFARIATQKLTSNGDCRFTPIWKVKEANYHSKNDVWMGILTIFEAKVATDDIQREFLRLETFFNHIPSMQLFSSNMSAPANRLRGLDIGTHWDQKERIFRNIGGLIGPRDDPVLVHRWVHGDEFHVRLVWQDPLNVIAGMYQMKVEKKWVISFHKPTFTKPLRPGTWTVKLIYNDDIVLGVIKFLVIPQAYFLGKPASLEDVVATNNGPPAGLYSSDFVIEFDRDANDTEKRVKEFSENSSKTATQLNSWIDKNVLEHWELVDTCALVESRFMKCGGVPSCYKTEWSSMSPDPKSEVGVVNENGRLR